MKKNEKTKTKKIKVGRQGRTKGSYSFVTLKLSDICGKFADEHQPVVVSRKWAEAVGWVPIIAKHHAFFDNFSLIGEVTG